MFGVSSLVLTDHPDLTWTWMGGNNLGNQALFMCKDKEVDCCAFKAVDNANLVFDGRLVIDASFRTNDEFIYGAGTFTRLSHRYFAYHRSGVLFNSKEIGTTLAKRIIELFHPTEDTDIKDEVDNLPDYKEPVAVHAKLPCGWYYARIQKPKLKYDRISETDSRKKTSLKRLTSGTLFGKDPSFFQLEFNKFNEVETITCFAKYEIQVQNIRKLYGLHYTFLNNLFSRFESKQVKKILEFLSEPWSMALYHDCFHKFREDVRKLAYMRKHGDLLSLAEKVQMKQKNDPKLSEESRQELQQAFKDLGYEDDVKKLLRYYLAYYSPDLPMYSQRGWNDKYN